MKLAVYDYDGRLGEVDDDDLEGKGFIVAVLG